MWTSDAESKHLKTLLADCAQLGLIVAVSKPVYAEMKSQDLRKARVAVKEFTRHNDKLGFDFSIPSNGYYASYSTQFQESAYGGNDGFLAKAAQFYNDAGMTQTAAHFEKMLTKFDMKASAGARSAFLMPDDVSADRRIEGYISRIDDLEEQLSRSDRERAALLQEIAANQKTIKGYHDSVVLTPHQVVDYP